MILYRTHHKNHFFLSSVFFYTSIIAVSGTLAETIMIAVSTPTPQPNDTAKSRYPRSQYANAASYY